MDVLDWKKFSKKTMPESNTQILVCRDYTPNDTYGMFYTVVDVYDIDSMMYRTWEGIEKFIPEKRDRWTYIPRPKGR